MEKIWYIKIHDAREGPYSILDLKRDSRFTKDTLVWRKGFDRWQAARYVPELNIVFEEDEETIKREYESSANSFGDDEIVLEMGQNQPNKWIYFAIAIIIILYLWLHRVWM